jgi:UDP-N-acetyl-D-galactosamine dehydrogenase
VFNRGFFAGYSPERINPGRQAASRHQHPQSHVRLDPGSGRFRRPLYGSIIVAGTHKPVCIKVAEAAKVIENTQRDLNIALVNDLAILFNKLGIDTLEVLQAAGTKWNFLPFRPGPGRWSLHQRRSVLPHAQGAGSRASPGCDPRGRRTNDSMGPYIANEVIRLMVRKGINPVRACS